VCGVSSPILPSIAALGPTRTGARTLGRAEVVAVPATVELDVVVPSDRRLDAPIVRTRALDVLGLGPLPDDDAALAARVTRLVRAQGIAAVRLRLASARASAQHLKSLGAPRDIARADALLSRLDRMGPALERLTAEREHVRRGLTPRALVQAKRLLDAAERRVDAMVAQYRDPAELAALRSAAQDLLVARRRGPAAYAKAHRELAARHAILRRFDYDGPLEPLLDLARDTQVVRAGGQAIEVDRPAAWPVGTMLADAKSAIADMRERLERDPAAVWKLPSVIEATLIAEGVATSGMVAAHARDVVSEVHADEALWRTFVSIAAIGLGVAAALPSGGTSVAVGAAVTASLDAYQLYLSAEAYAFASDAWNAELSSEAPSGWGVAMDAVGATIGVAGAAVGLTKAAFAALLARSDAVGDAARGLSLRIGEARANALFARFGEEGATDAFHAMPSEVWTRLADVDDVAVHRAFDVLGAQRFGDLAHVMGSERFAAAVATTDAKTWANLLSTPLETKRLAKVLAIEPATLAAIAPHVKGEGLARIVTRIDPTAIGHAKGAFLTVHGQLRFNGFELLRAVDDGTFDAVEGTWSMLRAAAPEEMARFAMLSRRDVADLEALVVASFHGRPLDADRLGRVVARTNARRRDVVKLAWRIAEPSVQLSRRAEALARRVPELRMGLEILATTPGLGDAMIDGVVRRLERAVGARGATFSRAHLARWLEDAAAAGRGLPSALADRVEEIDYALEVVAAGRVAPGSTVYLGVEAGERVALARGGPWLELPTVDPNAKDTLQDLDVVFLGRDGAVNVVEVKKSDQALWEALEKTEGRYLEKFDALRSRSSSAVDLRVALRGSSEVWLDSVLRSVPESPRVKADEYGVRLETRGAP
jgi:hypothetical protein